MNFEGFLVVLACLGIFVVVVLIGYAFTGNTNQFKDDCEASGGTYSQLDASEYCKLNGEVYPR